MLLGLETATDVVGVALADELGPRAGAWLNGGRRHAEALAPAIAYVLEQAGSTLAEVDVVAVDVGPGLFTGLRAGVATAQGLAQGLGIGVLEVTSLSVLAREAYDAGWGGPVAAVVDARKGEVFSALYEAPTREVRPPKRFAPEELAAELERTPAILVVGAGAHRYPGTFAGLHVARLAEPSPRALVAVAADKLAEGAAPVPPAAVRPVYLREPDARINWVQR